MKDLEYGHVSDASDNVTFPEFPKERQQGSLSDNDKLHGQRKQLFIRLAKYLFLQH